MPHSSLTEELKNCAADVPPHSKKCISLLQCQKGLKTMGMPIHLHPFGTEQAIFVIRQTAVSSITMTAPLDKEKSCTLYVMPYYNFV